MGESETSRRRFLARVTLGIGGAIGAVLAYPLARYAWFPVGRKTVTSAAEPIDVLAVDALKPGAPPVRVTLTAASLRDGWNTASDVALGAAYVRKTEAGDIEALSSTCPHLGCAIELDRDEKLYKCPCHRSAFSLDGDRLSGPSKRGLDPLPVSVADGRVRVTFVRYRADVPEREPV
jgi:menaquinol-cytochrome c reductase iron-sulfur subunit